MAAYFVLTILFFYYALLADAEITRHKSMGSLFGALEKDIDVLELKWEEMSLNEKEIHATRDDKVYDVYEKHRISVTIAPDEQKIRIKSKDDSRPPECTADGHPGDKVVCPTSNRNSNWWTCLKPSKICDGVPQCQNGEDENAMFCMFYKATRITIHDQAHHFEEDLEEFNKKMKRIGHLVLTQKEK